MEADDRAAMNQKQPDQGANMNRTEGESCQKTNSSQAEFDKHGDGLTEVDK